jgi:hypothetical protein
VQGGRDPARGRREALEGMAGHEVVGGKGHGGGFHRLSAQQRKSNFCLFLCYLSLYKNREDDTSPSYVEGNKEAPAVR